jgi:DHA3 family tetracycline resistance protein-like MFS transporter
MTLVGALRHRSFAWLWTGQAISRLGDSINRVALSWWVLEQTGSAAVMGTVLIFSFTPMLLFLLIGGVAGDRLPRVRLMLGSDLLRGGVVAIVAALTASHTLQIWHLYVASMVFGLLDAFFQPAYTALVPEITPAPMLPSANSLTSLSGQLSNIAGPAIGAGIVAAGGTALAFAIDSLSFFLSAACLIPLIGLAQAPRPTGQGARHMLRDLRAGIRAVLASPWLWITIALAALFNITQGGPFAVALPFLVKDSLHADVGVLGLLYSMTSAGAVLSAVWLGRATKLRRRGLLAYLGLLAGSLTTLMLGLPLPLPVIAVVILLNGAAITVFGLIWTNTLQELVPRDLLGRVASIDMLGSFALVPIGYGLAGWATDLLGPALVFIGGGALTCLLVLAGLAHPGIRHLD